MRDEVAKALALDQGNPEAYWQRGVLERMQGAVEDAIKDEKRALELRPSRYEAHAVLAECYGDKNNDSAAAAEWQLALAGEQIQIRKGSGVVELRPAQATQPAVDERLTPREALRRLQEDAHMTPQQAKGYLRELREEWLAVESRRPA